MRRWVADLAWSVLLTAAVQLPLQASTGYWLAGDMVFTPHQPWKPAWLGLDGVLPRAVPMDAIVSVMTYAVPGWVVQHLFLGAAFVLGGVGAGRLVTRLGDGLRWWARLPAISLFLWNPWVYDRLLIGQWAILVGYLALPWVALAAFELRRDVRRGLGAAFVAAVVSAICSPSSGLMAGLVLVVLGLRATRRHVAAVVGIVVLANLPWLLPALLARTAEVTTHGVFAAFGARAESAAGLWPSLLSLGGIWKTSIVAGERTNAVLVVVSCLLTVVALAGLLSRRRPGAPEPRLLLLGGISLVLAALPSVAGGLLESAGHHVPALALLRDSHRFLAPAVLPLLPGVSAAATWVGSRVAPGREALWAVVGLLAVVPPLLLPSLTWGAWGGLRPSYYPGDWSHVADVMSMDPAATVVLPWAGSYRGFDWNHRRAVLDPAPRALPGDVLIDDRIFVDDLVVPSEDPAVVAVAGVLAGRDPNAQAAGLRALGVRWVLVEHGMPSGPVPTGTTAYDGPALTLVDLGPATGRLHRGPGIAGRAAIIAGDVVTAGLLFWAVAGRLRRRDCYRPHTSGRGGA